GVGGGPPERRRHGGAVGPCPHQREQDLQAPADVADRAEAGRDVPADQRRIGGQVQQLGAGGQRRHRRVRIDEERLGADDEDPPVARQGGGHGGGAEGQHAAPQRVVGGEVQVGVERRAVDGGAEGL